VALSHAQSSDSETVNRVLARLGDRVQELAVLFRHASTLVVKRSSLLVLGLVQGMEDVPRAELQDAMRANCGLLPQIRLASRPFVTAHAISRADHAASRADAPSCSSSAPTETEGAMVIQSLLSAQLVELLVEDNARSMDLLSRILPASLLAALSVPWQESATATLQQRGSVATSLLLHAPLHYLYTFPATPIRRPPLLASHTRCAVGGAACSPGAATTAFTLILNPLALTYTLNLHLKPCTLILHPVPSPKP
jgi:hypothetical protein